MDIKEVLKVGNINKEYKFKGDIYRVTSDLEILILVNIKNNKLIEDEKSLVDIVNENFKEVVDWSKVEVDTPIIVKDAERAKWVKSHFAKYKDGYVWAWSNGKTSHTVENDKECTGWEYAELI